MINAAERFRVALSACARDDFAAARAAGEEALAVQPRNVSLLQLMGVVYCRLGDARAGAECFRRAIDCGADTPDNQFNLARALLAAGEFAAALAIATPRAGTSGEFARLHGDILRQQGRDADAVAAYRRHVAAAPEDAEGWNNLGTALQAGGQGDEALEALERASKLDPRSSQIHINLARTLAGVGRNEDACRMFERAALLAPEDAQPLLELGRALTAIDESAIALRALADAVRRAPNDPRIFIAIGLAHLDLEDRAKAERAFRHAVRLAPQVAASYLNLGILLEKENRLKELAALIAEARAAGATGDEMDFLDALRLSREGRLAEALDRTDHVQSSAIHPAQIAEFRGRAADRLGDTERAYASYSLMNKAMADSPGGRRADPAGYRQAIDALATATTAEWYREWSQPQVRLDRPSPVFLVGFPRSGTTLLDTLLLGHPRIHVLEELPILEKLAHGFAPDRLASLDANEIERLRADYFAELDRRSPPPPGTIVVDKNPLSMIRAPLIHRMFPDARIILAMRHPCDVVLSCWMQNFKPTSAMANFLDFGDAARTYDTLFAYWERCRSVLPLRVHELRYEAMVADAEAALRPLIGFIGLEWEASLLDHQKTARDRGFIRTPSYAQVTEPVYTRSSGRWLAYRQHLEPILPILSPWIERFGYEPL